MTDEKSSKDILIEVASRLFRLRGYYGVGLNDIIEESGIPKGSLYYYFPGGKEELAIEAIHYSKRIVMNDIQESLGQTEDPVRALQAHLYQLSKIFGGGESSQGLSFAAIAGEKHSTSEAIRLACQSAFQSWQSIYAEKLLVAGFNEQQAEDLSITVHALIEGGILLAVTEKSGRPLQVIAEQIPLLISFSGVQTPAE
ncbi:TetR/AcrR family transcriptional regulator [Sporosarcina sp. FSL K6-3457]|uniref:TetR/AcrR family transcriptional regulator n=1 Tax=Sporosarcina sp. FSL K6-3457 TaxID=2978204 RepID=UPI0030F7CFF7